MSYMALPVLAQISYSSTRSPTVAPSLPPSSFSFPLSFLSISLPLTLSLFLPRFLALATPHLTRAARGAAQSLVTRSVFNQLCTSLVCLETLLLHQGNADQLAE